jgi:hypothetical protein
MTALLKSFTKQSRKPAPEGPKSYKEAPSRHFLISSCTGPNGHTKEKVTQSPQHCDRIRKNNISVQK